MRIGIPVGMLIWGYLILICWPILNSICQECHLQHLVESISPPPLGFYPAQLQLQNPIHIEEELPKRWNKTLLKYYVPPHPYRDELIRAFEIWSKYSGRFEFQPGEHGAQIQVKFVAWLPGPELGEAKLSLVNTTRYNLITQAQIELSTTHDGSPLSQIQMINLGLHEIGHALGLDHSSDPSSIMYPKLQMGLDKIIYPREQELRELDRLYKDPVLPDLVLENANLTRIGDKLQIKITILNSGLDTARDADLEIWSRDRLVDSHRIPELPPGNRMEMIFVLERAMVTRISLDPWNEIPELDEHNNEARI